MADSGKHAQDAITEEEMTGEAVSAPDPSTNKRSNAFTELMMRKRPNTTKQSYKSTSVPGATTTFFGRDGLGAYIAHPEAFGPERVISYTDDWVVINDMYPKSVIHLLLLPRDPAKTLLHPYDAFEDAKFLEACKAELEKVKQIVASELRRRYGRGSKQDQARNEAMDSDDTPGPDELPEGRDWSQGLLTGIHAYPSMSNLHIHCLSPDRNSPCLKHRKHYNSFSTPFLVPLEAFPLPQDDPRRHPGRAGYMNREFVCWRCQRNFGKSFAKLKEHLGEEFDEWKTE
ncbi:uncharacterized protein K452DRAFT_276691 [Aplosporella prunicola CBS 121167]|uniref:Aprataxin-like protein n=1 Tax=Aplosporella prunicola CBS 121167 TaxID=1176127 RepID=A0A6A6B625_9PEZI|nr:uncharacterized protein K452DRAFT_276691 [Aplosporella prunicola CBS 121167]KAF2138863.1 hypothetical protein K452DRAFT_276691 [Aplosporella prunicola CBS 121167]